MVNKKIAGLFAALLLSGIIQTSAYALDLSATASQTLQAQLEAYIKIEALDDDSTLTTDIDPASGDLERALVSVFKVFYNNPPNAQTLYLQAKTASTTNPEEVAFFQQGPVTYIILSNTTHKPLPLAVANCRDSDPDAADNANAIAYPVTGVVLDSGTATYDAKNQYSVPISAAETLVTTTIGTTVREDTYSFVDTAGPYEAIMTLTTISL